MSIDIDWHTLTTGPDGLALAESIKDFIHEKFQQVELPRFIRSVQVHTFEFGKECPVVELKDICDPFAEFYETDDNEEEDDEEEEGEDRDSGGSRPEREDLIMRPPSEAHRPTNNNTAFSYNPPSSSSISRPSFIDTRHAGLRSNLDLTDHVTPFLARSNTPGIPGGTTNLSYFHLPLGAGLSGSQTPLAAVAGGTPFSPGWDYHGFAAASQRRDNNHPSRHASSYSDPSSRPSTAESYQEMKKHTTGDEDPPEESESTTSTARKTMPDPMDTQVVLHISYQGTIRLSITAEILLDYPMPSFVGIPLKLNIIGLSFDGVALIAYLRKRAHFCFLTPDDAQTLVGVNSHSHSHEAETGTGSAAAGRGGGSSSGVKLGSLLREIRVESEIGRKEEGKQVLKNVGKVEKFVLDQVRRIFQDEFVWPSSWTFLV